MQMKGFNRVNHVIKNKVIRSIRDSRSLLTQYLRGQLTSNTDSTGDMFPRKAESTKKAYRDKGLNTEQWLIASGKSTELKFSNKSGGLEIKPADPNKILRYVEQSKEWFSLNDDIKKQIIERIKKELK